MQQLLVSVVLGTYNGGEYLNAQIDSILRQTYRPLELVISDDASTDNTVEILKSYERDERVRIFYQQKNLGLPANYSFVASKARGDFIAFSDQDDIWMEHKIEKLVSAIGENPLVYSDSILVDGAGRSLNKKLSHLKRMYTGADSRGYFLYSCVWGHGMLVKKDFLEKCLPIPLAVHHDIWIAYQAFLNGGIKYLNEALTWYRQSKKNGIGHHEIEEAKERRYVEYRKKLDWLLLMRTFERSEHVIFYDRLYELYKKKQTGAYVFSLVPFMLRHRQSIFSLSRKGFASHFVEILKQARGVGNPN